MNQEAITGGVTSETVTYPRLEKRSAAALVKATQPCAMRAPRDHAQLELHATLARHGLLRPPVVSARTGTILDGRALVTAAALAGDVELDVWVVDVEPQDEALVRMALNTPVSDWIWSELAGELRKLKERGLLALTLMPESDTGPLTAADWSPEALAALDASAPPAQRELFG